MLTAGSRQLVGGFGLSESPFWVSAPGSLLASLQNPPLRQMNPNQQLRTNQGEGGRAHLRNCASNLVLHQSCRSE